jgi:general secretion pathway protein F
MPVFQYRGFDSKGKPVSGIKDADSPRTLRQNLRRDGVMLTEVKEASSAKGGSAAPGAGPAVADSGDLGGAVLSMLSPTRIRAWFSVRSDANPQLIAVMTRQLASMLRAGVQLAESLTALIEQAERPGLKRVLSDLKVQVNEGVSLSGALARHPRFFSELYVHLVAAGEAAGNLEAVLFRLASFLEAQNRLRSKVVSALFYPLIMTVIGGGILTMLMTTVVPKVTAIFADTGRALPFNTQVLIFLSTVVSEYLWLVAIVVIGAVILFQRWVRSPKGRLAWDRFILKVPIIGELTRKVAVSRFAKTLATMLASGVQLLRAMEIVKNVLGNTVLTKVVEEARESIREGESIAQPLRRSGEFPVIVCHMIAVGERSGQLEQMLENVATDYDLEVDMQISRLTTLLEPLMILAMGGSVGFVVFSILLPIMQMSDFVQ